MDSDTDTDGYRYNTDGYRWINCLISFGTPDLMDGQIESMIVSMIVQYRWIQIQIQMDTDTIQMDKLFNFIWNFRMDGWID